MKQRKHTSKRQAPTYEKVGENSSEQLDEAIQIFTAGTTDAERAELQEAFRAIATVPRSSSPCASETYDRVYEAARAFNEVKPAPAVKEAKARGHKLGLQDAEDEKDFAPYLERHTHQKDGAA